MKVLDLILAKRGGASIPSAKLREFAAAVGRGEIPDYQVSAFLMAVFFQGMDAGETEVFTRALAESGRVYDWSHLARPTADKHSTGGVGDKVSLVLAPLAAACGLAVPMLSGRGLGFTGGTLDKLESIPGFQTRLSDERFREIMEAEGLCLIGQSEQMAPADRRLYALRDVTGTIESIPLIVSSILGKKLAAGPRSLVIDLKVGSGAFMKDLDQARQLGEALRSTADRLGIACTVVFTAMDLPLGTRVGNGPEVLESLEILSGKGPARLRELTLVLVDEMLRLSGLAAGREQARRLSEPALDEGRALERFLAMAAAQGGKLDPDSPDWGMPEAPVQRTISAASAGWMPGPDARRVGELAVELGAGRLRAEDPVDPRAGIHFLKDWGDEVAAGEVLARVEGSDGGRVDHVARALEEMLRPDPEPCRPGSLLLALLDGEGYRDWPARLAR